MNRVDTLPRTPFEPSRRELLRLAGNGFGLLGLAALLADESAATALARSATGRQSAGRAAAASCAARQARASSCSCRAGRRTSTLFDPKPRLAGTTASRCPSRSRS